MKVLLVMMLVLSLAKSRGQVIKPPPGIKPTAGMNTNAVTLLKDTTTPGPTVMKLTTTVNNKLSAGFLCEGFVRQPNGQPITGFLVSVDGKNLSFTTGNDGRFQLLIKKGDLLVFSKQGYVSVQMDPFSGPNFSSSLMRVSMTVTEQFFYAKEVKAETLNIFPLPYPAPSGIYDFRVNLSRQLHTLGEVNDLLKASLDNCRYDEKRWYCVPHGFALITTMEQTSEAGISLNPPERWSAGVVGHLNSPLDYFKAFLKVPQGYFRVFVFLVTDVNPGSSGKQISEDEARKWLGLGYARLPEELRALPLTPSHSCNLLVYQYKKDPGQKAEQIRQLSGREHFERSHLAQFITDKH